MKVTLNKGRIHSVTIQGGFTDPYVNLELSPQVAYELYLALQAKQNDLRNMAENYYDCPDCGGTHQKSVQPCPNIEQEEIGK